MSSRANGFAVSCADRVRHSLVCLPQWSRSKAGAMGVAITGCGVWLRVWLGLGLAGARSLARTRAGWG